MKKIREDAIYVQKKDLAYLINSDLGVPASIYMKVFGSGPTIIDNTNCNDFVRFDEDREIKFFMEAYWIFDYDKFINMSEEELIDYGQQIANEKNSIAREFNAFSEDEKIDNMIMVQQCQLLDYEMYSLGDIIKEKRKMKKISKGKEEKKGLLTFIKKIGSKHK
jgi:hypothetical protein